MEEEKRVREDDQEKSEEKEGEAPAGAGAKTAKTGPPGEDLKHLKRFRRSARRFIVDQLEVVFAHDGIQQMLQPGAAAVMLFDIIGKEGRHLGRELEYVDLRKILQLNARRQRAGIEQHFS